MMHRAARLAALALLVSTGHLAGGAFASPDDSKGTETSSSPSAEEKRQDDALKAIEQGFSIPAADGAATKDGTQEKGTTKK